MNQKKYFFIVLVAVIFCIGISIYTQKQDRTTAVSTGAELSSTVSGNAALTGKRTVSGNFAEFAGGTVSGAELPVLTVSENEAEPVKVKGIYVTGPMAGSSHMDELIALVDETELNTMVIDIKNDEGFITYQMDLAAAKSIGACTAYISDMDGLMKKLKEHNIHTIARIVCFKDPNFAESNPQLALKTADGKFVTDTDGAAWVNPYRPEVWKYITDVAIKAAELGFDEIQFDYVRFPSGKDAGLADYGVDTNAYSKEQAVLDFLAFACERFHEKDVVVGADVFGTIIDNEGDGESIGQNYQKLGSAVDVLSPMIYPSHYRNGVYGLDVPDAHPYETVAAALAASDNKLRTVAVEERAVVRPWLQSFTATWVPGHISYGGEQIKKQIQAVYDAGYEEWILWNAANRYPEEDFIPEEENENAENFNQSATFLPNEKY